MQTHPPADTALTVAPSPADAPNSASQGAERAFSLSLMFSGVRCIIQYAVLPFMLPVIGIAGDLAVQISFVINMMAIAAIIYSIRTFFRVNYKYKWQYLPVGLVALILLSAFLLLDMAEIWQMLAR